MVTREPPVIVRVDGKLTDETAEALKAAFRAAVRAGGPPIVLADNDDWVLGQAAAILRRRATRKTFTLDVICRVLTNAAAKIRTERTTDAPVSAPSPPRAPPPPSPSASPPPRSTRRSSGRPGGTPTTGTPASAPGNCGRSAKARCGAPWTSSSCGPSPMVQVRRCPIAWSGTRRSSSARARRRHPWNSTSAGASDVGWDELFTGESVAHAWCAACPHFHARGTGREEISRVMHAVADHAAGRDGFVPDAGCVHNVHLEVKQRP